MKPVIVITADGVNITEKIAQRLISLTITDEVGLVSDKADILLDNRDDAFDLPPRGAILTIALGYEQGALAEMGQFVVDDIECMIAPAHMRISAKASDTPIRDMFGAIKSPKNRSWHERMLADIIHTIAEEHSFEALVDPYFEEMFIDHLDQTDESDISFLQRLAQDYDAMIKPANGKLIFSRKGRGTTLTGKEMPTIILTKQDIANGSVKISERGKYSKVHAKWHNFATGEEETVSVGEGEPAYSMRHHFADETRALEAAKAKLKTFQRGKFELNLTLLGNPLLSAESKLQPVQISKAMDREWVISHVQHQMGDAGYQCQITAQLPIEE